MHESLRAKNKRRINEKCARMRAARERIRLELPAPEYPAELSDNWAEITVRRCVNGHVQTESIFLDGLSTRTYAAWDMTTKEHIGAMGLSKAIREIVKRFPQIRLLHD